MCDRTFALFQRVTKKCDCTIALLKWANVQKCAKKGANFEIALFRILKNYTIALLKRANVLKCAKKVQKMCNFKIHTSFAHLLMQSHFLRTFSKRDKSAIAHSHIFKEQQNVQSHICTFSKSKNVQCANVRLPNLAISLLFISEFLTCFGEMYRTAVPGYCVELYRSTRLLRWIRS